MLSGLRASPSGALCDCSVNVNLAQTATGGRGGFQRCPVSKGLSCAEDLSSGFFKIGLCAVCRAIACHVLIGMLSSMTSAGLKTASQEQGLRRVQVHCSPDRLKGDANMLMLVVQSSLHLWSDAAPIPQPLPPCKQHMPTDVIQRKTDMHGRVDAFTYKCGGCSRRDVTEMAHRLAASLAAGRNSPMTTDSGGGRCKCVSWASRIIS